MNESEIKTPNIEENKQTDDTTEQKKDDRPRLEKYPNLLRGNPATQFKSGPQQVEMAKKGRRAATKKKREQRKFSETLAILLEMPLAEGKIDELAKIPGFQSLKGKNISVKEAIAVKQIQKAIQGDQRATEFIRDTIGEAITQQVELKGSVPIQIVDDIPETPPKKPSDDDD